MPIFRVTLDREYTSREVMILDLEADTLKEAWAEADKMIAEESLDESDWSEVDGRESPATVRAAELIAETNDVIETS